MMMLEAYKEILGTEINNRNHNSRGIENILWHPFVPMNWTSSCNNLFSYVYTLNTRMHRRNNLNVSNIMEMKSNTR